MTEEYDILIKNASIVDGSVRDSFRGSLATEGERIAAVGESVEGDAKTVIDVNGLTVAPGFIDVHNHADLSILYYPEAESFLRQGITTFVGGNCGDSTGPYRDYISEPWFLCDVYDDVSPYMYYRSWLMPRGLVNLRHMEIFGWEIDWHTLGEFLKRVEAQGLAPNFIPLVGHGDVRAYVMESDFRRAATKEEVRAMQEQIEVAMGEGCRGLSVGRDYEPGFWANFDELVACAEVAAKYGGIYTSHCLYKGPGRPLKPGELPPPRLNGVLEAIEIGRKCKIPVQISHLSPLYDVVPGGSEVMTEASVRATLKVIDDARRDGVEVSFDLIPNHLSGGIYTSQYLYTLLLPWVKVTGSPEGFAKALKMEEFRADIKEVVRNGRWFSLHLSYNPDWLDRSTIVECKDARFVGKTVGKAATELNVEPLDALMDILAIDPYTKAVRKGDDDLAKLMLYKHPEMMIGVDTFAIDERFERRNPPWFLPNENSYGGFPRYFRRSVRETGTLTLNEAIRKVTSLPAKKFKLRDRGIIREGAYADIVIINPETITDKGDQINPRCYPEGVEYVVVNGVLVVERGKHTRERPGKILYRE
jgi:N-acyl-D-aspartate/D-glutamate deacylase